jgi:sugar/nucleoside kinase (ribokinase family)
LNALIAGFITIDTIELPVRTITSIGGPPTYAGLLCSRFGLDVTCLTKIGTDFPREQLVWLSRNGLQLRAVDRSTAKKTTRFRLDIRAGERTLYLVDRCEDITLEQVPEGRFNGALVSPLAHEISRGVFDAIRSRCDFCFLDPQGFLRSFDSLGKTSLKSWSDYGILGSIDAVKMDSEEAEATTGKTDTKEALEKLFHKKVRKAVITRGGESTYVLDGSRISRIDVPKVRVVDTTGAGDILLGAMMTCYLRSRDFLWSCCFGVAASSLSLTSIALAKVDLPRSVDQEARRLYSSTVVVASV